ncbi:hypothetical protein GCM10011375_39040 [Hymenobacter qilianensis]|uniref:Uncharacterized protein n=2 Tax=Hymenobacter qilianensis TaxID=1385715 RepID=A0ACB5PWZ1_9BACT|nr:hypothetical protein [Hymenobacter qilianensis]QNP54312.1 hypothetical protein H9L05_21000 [Hymenobacter qilianensis]GGF80160.1 hypothetical protein GCM10011375_39040 [Hymenobacter qilianensis]
MKEFTEEEALQALAFLTKLVVGLDRLGSRYADKDEDLAWALLYSFEPNVFKEAAQVRQMLCSKYSQELQEGEDQDEVEKVLADVAYWKLPTAKQLARFRANRLKKQRPGSSS